MGQTANVPLPRYRSHKEVWALKIKSVASLGVTGEDGALLTPDGDAYARFKVSADYVHKHNPKAGGYWVRYDDGYESFSPSEAFESCYTRVL